MLYENKKARALRLDAYFWSGVAFRVAGDKEEEGDFIRSDKKDSKNSHNIRKNLFHMGMGDFRGLVFTSHNSHS